MFFGNTRKYENCPRINLHRAKCSPTIVLDMAATKRDSPQRRRDPFLGTPSSQLRLLVS
jgi:hypothetical protein